MHIVELTVNRDPNTSETTVCQSAHKVRVFDSECYSITCDASYYDIVEEAASATASSGVVAGALEYSMLQRGDAPPRELGISFPDGQYLPGFPNKHQFLSAGEWGQDMDVRRVLLQSGSLCGSGIYSNHCVNMGKAVVDETWPATAIETRYIFTVQSGPGMLKNVKVAVQKDENDDVFITAIDAGYLNRPCAASSSAADLYACDVQNAENMGANYKNSGACPRRADTAWGSSSTRWRRRCRLRFCEARCRRSPRLRFCEACTHSSISPPLRLLSHHIKYHCQYHTFVSSRPRAREIRDASATSRIVTRARVYLTRARVRLTRARVRLTRDRCLPHRPPGFRFCSSRS